MSDDLTDVIDGLESLEESAESGRRKRLLRRAVRGLRDASARPARRLVRGFGWRDLAEAYVGSFFVGISLLVEGGTLEIGAYLAGHPAHLAGTVVGGAGAVIALLYGTKFRRVAVVNPIFGFIPRRVVGIAAAAVSTSILLMTGWGRVDWADPRTAWSQITFVAVIMALGAAISDLIPQE